MMFLINLFLAIIVFALLIYTFTWYCWNKTFPEEYRIKMKFKDFVTSYKVNEERYILSEERMDSNWEFYTFYRLYFVKDLSNRNKQNYENYIQINFNWIDLIRFVLFCKSENKRGTIEINTRVHKEMLEIMQKDIESYLNKNN